MSIPEERRYRCSSYRTRARLHWTFGGQGVDPAQVSFMDLSADGRIVA